MANIDHDKIASELCDQSVTSTDDTSDNFFSYTLTAENSSQGSLDEQDEDREKMSANISTDDGHIANSTAESSKSTESASFTSITVTSSVPTVTETSTDYESTRTNVASCSDNSDSAYTNSRSNFTKTLDSNATYTSEVQHSEISDENDTHPGFEAGKSRNLNESSTQTPGTANLNVISNVRLSEATLNVIFNQVLKDVGDKQPDSLNMSSLNALIPLTSENEVDHEDFNAIPDDSKVINVQPVPSFYLNCKEDIVVTQEHSRVIKYMMSNVHAGSPYKPAEIPHVIVPRCSGLPRSSSMEVNTSSLDSTDKESDTVSLVDSLEDGVSPRSPPNAPNSREYEDILLPDNSEVAKSKTPQLKSTVFFIPIQNKQEEDFKPVSYHLPPKVKERLARRQLRREQKIQQAKSSYNSPRSDSNYISASDNGNQFSFTVNNNADYVDVKSIPLFPDINNHKIRRKSRAPIPSIENVRKIRIDSKDNNIKVTQCERFRDRGNKSMKKRFVTKYIDKNVTGGDNQRHQNSRTFHKAPAKLTPIYTSRNEYTCESMPKESYHKTEFGNSSKHIEILEIVECLDDSQKHQSNSSKSKIPILVQNKLPKIEKKYSLPKPVYLDFETVQSRDPKIDQLIANILIDTLNKYEHLTPSPPNNENSDKRNISKVTDEKIPADVFVETSSRYKQKFEVIPEELSRQSSLEESSNKSEQITSTSTVIEAAAQILTKNVLKNNTMQEQLNKSSKNSSNNTSRSEDIKINPLFSIPRGWVTFYMLHKNQTSPDSTSDEGSKKPRSHISKYSKKENSNNQKDTNTKSERPLESYEDLAINKKDTKSRRDTLDTILSSDAFSDNLNSVVPHNDQSSKQNTFKNLNNNNTDCHNNKFTSCEQSNNTHNWSVTVSGMNTRGQYAPDVEMRLKFPTSKENVDFGSQTKLDHAENVDDNTMYCYPTERPCQLLKRHNHQNCMNSVANITAGDESFRSGRLPNINQTRKFSQQIDPNLSNSVVPFGLEPRQTKTSTRRYALSRHRSLQSTDVNVTDENFLNFSPQIGILRRFPQILTVNGNSVDPEDRSSVYNNRG